MKPEEKQKRARLRRVVEALLFVSASPLSSGRISRVMEEADTSLVRELLEELRQEYDTSGKPVFIQKVAGGWRMATRPEYAEWVRKLFSGDMVLRLSRAAMETLAIIAYRQPVTTQDVELIRGVSSGAVIRGLLEKRLVKIAGRKEVIGRPILYRTTERFLEYFGLESVADLPPLEELGIEREIQELIDERDKKENRPDRSQDQQSA